MALGRQEVAVLTTSEAPRDGDLRTAAPHFDWAWPSLGEKLGDP